MGMMTTTRMLIAMMMLMMMSLVFAQSPWPSLPEESCREKLQKEIIEVVTNNQQDQFLEFFCADTQDLEATGRYKQLWVTDQEVEEACKQVHASAFIKLGGATAPHPRTCFAYLRCLGRMFNPTQENTTYLYNVKVEGTSAGVYYDPVSHWGQTWTVDNNCPVDPCKTQKNMMTGRACNTYVTCGKDSDGNAQHQQKTCPDGYGFSVTLGTCAPDVNCTLPAPLNKTVTVNLRCYATGRPQDRPEIPGVPDTAYYNRTYRVVDTGEVVTVQQMCPASTVFDPNNSNCTQLCQCVLQSIETCRNITLILAGHTTPFPWADVIDAHVYDVPVDTQGVNQGWAHFQRGEDFNYFDAQALAENELAGDWSLAFRFKLNPAGGNPDNFTLAENSHDLVACPSPSLRVSVLQSTSLRADVITKGNNRTVGTQLDNLVNLTVWEAIEVVVERRGDTLALKARKQKNAQFQEKTARGLGRGPLVAKRCGLVFGKDFSGWLEWVKLNKYTC